MAIQYSKPYSQNGSPVAAVKLSDLMLVSVKVPVSTSAPYGFQTVNKTLAAAQSYFFNTITVNGLSTYIKIGEGLAGTGTEADPIRLDLDWMNERYHSNVDFPISQVGDMTDFRLPISGSYFSVTYPLTANPFAPTAFVEGNGDLRILNHVSNGEEFRVVNGVCKNYRNAPMNTSVFTDVVYRPPGLLSNEYIHNVFNMSTTAMVAEIWNESGFKEYAFITLNGTAVADYHTVLRLGIQPLEVFYGSAGVSTTANLQVNIQRFRWANVSAVIVRGKKYLVHTYLDKTDPALSYNFTAFAEVTNSGSCTLLTNWTTTNIQGDVKTHQSGAFIHKDLATLEPTNKDAMYVVLDQQVTVSSPQSWHCVRSSVGGLTPEGYPILSIRRYDVANTLTSIQAMKPNFYYYIDFENHRVFPAQGADNTRWVCNANASNALEVTRNSIEYLGGHYYASITNLQPLGDGNRVGFIYTTSANDIQTAISVWRGTATKGYQAGDDSYFSSSYSDLVAIGVNPPTPVFPLRTPFFLYDSLLIANATVVGTHPAGISKVIARLKGSPTGKTYHILQTNTFAAPIDIPGYVLNNDRFNISVNQLPAIVSFRKNGVIKYHNAMWGRSEESTKPERVIGIDADFGYAGKYNIAQAVFDKINAWANTLAKPDGYPDILDFNWIIMAPMPGMTSNHIWMKLYISYKLDDATDPRGYKPYGSNFHYEMIPCTLTTSGSDVTLADVDFSGVSVAPVSTAFVSSYLNPKFNADHGAGAVDVQNDKYVVSFRGGYYTSTHTGTSNHFIQVWNAHFDATTYSRTKVVQSGGLYIPTIHPVHGFGMLENATVGMGAFYIFARYDMEAFTRDTSYLRIVGTSRPAAGFNLTISAPIPIYSRGTYSEIPVQTFDLTTVKADPRWTTFYMYAVVGSDGTADFVVSLTGKPDSDNTIYLGEIVTSETEIVKMDTFPITRWENHRPSAYLRGASIPVSTGSPASAGRIEWVEDIIPPDVSNTSVIIDAITGDDYLDSVESSSSSLSITGSIVNTPEDAATITISAVIGDVTKEVSIAGNVSTYSIPVVGIDLVSNTARRVTITASFKDAAGNAATVTTGRTYMVWGDTSIDITGDYSTGTYTLQMAPGQRNTFALVGGGGAGGSSVWEDYPYGRAGSGGATQLSKTSGESIANIGGGQGGVSGQWSNGSWLHNGLAGSGGQINLASSTAEFSIESITYIPGNDAPKATISNHIGAASVSTIGNWGAGGNGADGVGDEGHGYGGGGGSGAYVLFKITNMTDETQSITLVVGGGGQTAPSNGRVGFAGVSGFARITAG